MLSLVPTAELPWYRHIWDRLEQAHRGGAFDEHAPLVEELLARIREHGPTSAADFESREAIDWYWRPTNPVRAMLEALAEAGILGIARREGNRRIYDLVGRLFPADLLAVRVPVEEQLCHKLLSRYRGNGLLGATGEYSLWMGIGKAPVRARVLSQLVDGGALVPVDVEGFRGPRFVVAGEVPILDAAEASVAAGERMPDPGVAFVAPLDPLVWDRDLLRRLFAFDYVWEVYVPAPKRRHGYYTLPVLYGDRLVGRLDPKADRKSGTLGVLGLWWEDGFDPLSDANPGFVDAFADALRAHLAFTGTKKVALPRVARHRTFVQAVRARL
jgi:uncharacterized protein